MASFVGRWCGVMLILALMVPLGATTVSNSARADGHEASIKNAITRQLEAFRSKDADAAWAIAAPTIQRRFGNKNTFMDMVGNYYPQIMNSRSIVFKGLKTVDGNLVQHVFVEGGPGDFVDAYYTMAQIDGQWRITGVYITKPKGEGA